MPLSADRAEGRILEEEKAETMKRTNMIGIAIAVLGMAATAFGQAQQCNSVSGTLAESVLPAAAAPNDPFGRTLATVTGDLKGSKSAILLSVTPASNGGQTAKTKDVFVTEGKDILIADGDAAFTPIISSLGGAPNLQDILTLKISGGTGRYANASGTLKVQGWGRDVGPGTGFFTLEYSGSICVPAGTLLPASAKEEK